jgi:hypothetical protein
MRGKRLFDAPAQLGGLVLDGVDRGQQRQGDVPAGGGFAAGQPGRGGA